MNQTSTLTPDVVIIGGGPAGLTAAAELAHRIDGSVLVVEREHQAGGIPRHSDHPGYGIRDLHRFLRGPEYARRLRERAADAGARILTDSMATDWAGERAVNVTSPQGRLRVRARAVVLATGARERPRAARLIAGDRCHGVYTTGALQNVVHLKHAPVGRKAVVIGAELVSWSAVMTLRAAGCHTSLVTTRYPKADSYAIFDRAGRVLFRTEVRTRTRLVRVIGRPQVTAVELENLDTGRRVMEECDTVVVTGDWIPDNELARSAGLCIDPVSKSPQVDTALRTERSGLFAAGNLLHPVDTADAAALDGAAVADSVATYLGGDEGLSPSQVRLQVSRPLRWIEPSIMRLGDPSPPRRRLLTWSDELIAHPVVTVTQNGQVVARKRLPWPAAPGRVFRIPASMLEHLDVAAGGAATFSVN